VKNRQLIYVLIPSVLIIWGLIIMKVIRNIHHSQKQVIETSSISRGSELELINDSSSLILNYPDPFLRGINQMSSSSQERSNLQSATKTQINFPNTKYSGLVINYKSKHKLGLIKIENQDFLAEEGDFVAGEKILRLYNDSVIISFNKIKKTCLKN
jgi:hypothetical protein